MSTAIMWNIANNDFRTTVSQFSSRLISHVSHPSGTYGHNTHEGNDKTNLSDNLNYVNLQMNV